MSLQIQLFESRQILFKVESTPGQDAGPTGASNSLLSFTGNVAVMADKLERKPDRPFFGADPFLLVNKRCEVSFDIELIGSATPGNAAPIGPVLKACGMSETLNAGVSATYAPVSSGFTSGTLYFYIGALLYTSTYSMGSLDVTQEIKNFNRAKATFKGVVTNATMPSESAVSGVNTTAFQSPPATEAESWTLVTIPAGSTTLAAPVLNAPTTATVGGTVPAGTYKFTLTAYNANGQTIASNEVSQTTTGATSTVTNTWAAITGAAGYKLYATLVGGASGSEAFLVDVGNVLTYTWTGTPATPTAGVVPPTRNGTADILLYGKKLNFNMNNDVKVHETSSARVVAIMQRKPAGTLTYEETPLATFNPWTQAVNYTLNKVISIVGTAPGKICTITMPYCQLEMTKLVNMDGAICFETPFAPLPSSGNDEFSIQFT